MPVKPEPVAGKVPTHRREALVEAFAEAGSPTSRWVVVAPPIFPSDHSLG